MITECRHESPLLQAAEECPHKTLKEGHRENKSQEEGEDAAANENQRNSGSPPYVKPSGRRTKRKKKSPRVRGDHQTLFKKKTLVQRNTGSRGYSEGWCHGSSRGFLTSLRGGVASFGSTQWTEELAVTVVL